MTNSVSYQSLEEFADSADAVVVLGGYSGAGYNEEAAASLETNIKQMVKEKGDNAIYVIGVTPDGIGKAYDWIKEASDEAGFANVVTAGIVSEKAGKYPAAPNCDYAVFVADPEGTWQVNDENGISLMIKIAGDRAAKSEVRYYGGGLVSMAELDQAKAFDGLKILVAGNDEFQPLKPEKLNGRKPVDEWMAANPSAYTPATTNGKMSSFTNNHDQNGSSTGHPEAAPQPK